jgi:hypothetical protein
MRQALIALFVLAALAAPAAAQDNPWQAVPKAACSEGDRPETGLQGQVPLSERAGVFKGWWCNLRLVGQWEGEGASWQLASFDSCAYYSQADRVRSTGDPEDTTNPTKPGFEHPGTVVTDVSDPAKPAATDYLNDPGTNDSWESVETNMARKLVASAEEAGPGFAVYDISQDCQHPRKLFGGDVEGTGHAGGFAPDGKTYWSGQTLRAIDLADPAHPQTIAADVTAEFPTHDLGINADGTRVYLAVAGLAGTQNGLQILDVSDIQNRKPNPKIEVLGELSWADGGIAQNALPVTINGKPHIVFTDENSNQSLGQPATTAADCGEGLPPFGMARIIDISDERHPKLVSRLPLEVTDPANCPVVMADNTGTAIFGYDSHYCSVDDATDARLLACSYFQAGLRLFDIADPAHPREIAYYNPPMKPGYKPGSNYSLTGFGPPNGADWTPAHPQFRLERREIWFTSHMNGFQVVRLTPNIALPPRGGRPAALIPRPKLALRVRRAGRRLIVSGRLRLPAGVGRRDGCAGRITLRAGAAKRTVAVRRTCRIRAVLRTNRRRVALVARFHGNRRLLAVTKKVKAR